MSYQLKNLYSLEFYQYFTEIAKTVLPNFDKEQFLALIFTPTWQEKELKDRMRHTATCLQQFMPNSFSKASLLLLQLVEKLQKSEHKNKALEYLFLPDYIEKQGVHDFEIAMKTIAFVTPFTSCEFAIRPFIIKYPKQGMKQLLAWSTHESHHVRRLSSEGCRPRLPWAMALPDFKKNPAPILPILENLKTDTSDYVRRSVANNLNDISKDNPAIVLRISQQWIGKTKETDWMVKHACRTLLKQGNQQAMALFGYGSTEHLEVTNFQVITPIVKIGEALQFSFDLVNTQKQPSKVRLEYGLYYKKAKGNLSKKVFKISEKNYEGNSTTTITKKQSFKIITTRKFYTGLHRISIIVNGKEFQMLDFQLVN